MGTSLRRGVSLLGAVAIAIAILPLPAAAAATPTPVPHSSTPLRSPHSPVLPRPLTAVSPALSPGGTWSWQNPQPNGNALNAISCPTTTICFAAGDYGPVLATTDGGATWAQQATVSGILGISCPSTTVCVATDINGDVLTTTDGGANWSAQNLNGANFLYGVSCPSTTYCVTVGAAGAIFASSGGVTSWARQVSGASNDLYAVSCYAAGNCFAVGAGIILGPPPYWNAYTPGGNYYAISCPFTNSCLVVGQGGITRYWNGTYLAGNPVWTLGSTGSNVDLFGVSCAAQTIQGEYCYGAGADGKVYIAIMARTSVSSVEWGHASVGELGGLYGVSCPSAGVCFVAGDHSFVGTTTNGGTGWTAPAGQFAVGMYAVSCSSAANCTAVGDNGTVAWSSTGGRGWIVNYNYAGTQTLYGVSCPSDTLCVMGGQNGYIFKNSGPNSSPTQVGSTTADTITALDCPSTSICVAVTLLGLFLSSSDGGTTWSSPTLIDPWRLSGISCPTVTTCFVADGAGRVLTTADGGASWTVSFDLAKDPNGGTAGNFLGIACPNTTTCYAVGQPGLVATTLDGINWRTDNTPTSVPLLGVSCPAVDTCFVASSDATILNTVDDGGTWTAQFAASAASFNGVTCLSATSCIAVGSLSIPITQTTNGGAAWVKVHPSGSVTGLHHVACPDATNCYVTAFDAQNPGGVQVTHDGGTTWTVRALSKADQVQGISCPAANTCFAVGWPGAIYHSTDGFATATYQPNPLSYADQSLTSVSCTSTTTCYAVGTTGNVLSTSNAGISWQVESTGTTTNFWGVSCPTTGTCVAVGDNGTTMTRSGGAWHLHTAGTLAAFDSVSCPGATTCYAVGRQGLSVVTTNQGATWSFQTSGTTDDLLDIQCLQSNSCIAVGSNGTLIYTLDGITWAPDLIPTYYALRGVAFLSPGFVMAVGSGGTILEDQNLFFLCLTSSISSNLASPQAVGTTITLTASTGGCNHLFEFWLLPPGGSWVIVQSYSATSTYSWNTIGLRAGTYTFGVWARDAGSAGIGGSPPNTYDSFTSMQLTLTAVACGAATISAAPASPSTRGTQVTLTGGATGCPNPRYEFWALWQGATSWQLLSSWSASPTYMWNSTGALNGTERFGVWVRDASSSAAYDAYAGIPYSIAAPTCGSVTASANPTTTTHGTGAHVIITGVAAGCANPVYEFWLQPAGSSTWMLVQKYSTLATYDWNTTGAPAGTEHFGVWVRDTNSGAAYDSYVSLSFTLS